MDSSDLPSIVLRYFDLMEGADKSLVAALFTADAVVEDDGGTYRGRDEIVGWLTGPADAWNTTSRRLSSERDGDTTRVSTLVEGDFPGGRVELDHTFTQGRSGLLEALRITA